MIKLYLFVWILRNLSEMDARFVRYLDERSKDGVGPSNVRSTVPISMNYHGNKEFFNM